MSAHAEDAIATLSGAASGSFRPIEQPEKPPFDFRADLVLVAALVPVAPVRAAFAGVEFLTAGGRALLLAWFSRVHESSYRDAAGRAVWTRAEGHGAYAELTLLLVTRDGRFFVPSIEASSGLSQRLARAYYGMPKMLVQASFVQHDRRLIARVEQNLLEVHRLPGGTLLTTVARTLLPVCGRWRARFPSGGSARARLPWAQRVECVRIDQLHVAPQPPWLPDPPRPLGVGMLLQGARMRLLPPDQVSARSRR